MNFKIKRVFAVTMRHFAAVARPFELTTQLYWIGLDVVIFGFMTKSTCSTGNALSDSMIILTKLSFWHITSRSSIEMALTFIRDLEDMCFVGLMASPINLPEWICGQIIMGIFSSMINLVMGVICIKLLFGLNVLSTGLVIIPVLISLVVSSWIMGLFLISFLMLFGKKASSSVFAIAWILVPFSEVFYSVTALPQFCQNIAHWIPMYYIFDGLTQLIKNGTAINFSILKSMELNLFYFVVAVAVLVLIFRERKTTGLTRLELEG